MAYIASKSLEESGRISDRLAYLLLGKRTGPPAIWSQHCGPE